MPRKGRLTVLRVFVAKLRALLTGTVSDPALDYEMQAYLDLLALFGLFPSARLLRIEPQKVLQSSSRSATGSRHHNLLRRWLIGLQVFACTALLLVTGLFARSLAILLSSSKRFFTGACCNRRS
jgi:hypothetical protein